MFFDIAHAWSIDPESGSAEGALERLSEASGREFPNLLAARARTAEGLEQRRAQLASSDHDDDASVVLMGSWVRSVRVATCTGPGADA
jgi:hypothetical protein